MLQRWSKAITHVSKIGLQSDLKFGKDICAMTRQSYTKVAAAASSLTSTDFKEKDFTNEPKVNLDKMFWSKPCSLALAENSPLRVQEPNFAGMKRFFLKLLLFYSKQSKSIRGANVVYQRIVSQVDKPPIYEVFNLEKTFKTTFSLLVLHMWLCLRRLKQEGKEGVEFGQYLYEIYNHDVELRVSKAGVNLSKLETKCRAMTWVGKAIEARAPLMKLIRLKGVPILEQLHLEERLLRTSLDNWCLINDGTNSPAIVMGLSGKLSELVEVSSVLQDQIPVIRRFSGGGTVIVDQGTIFVTLICNKDAVPDIQPFPRSIMSWSGQLYSEVFEGIGDFRLRENDYVFGDCKFGGNAQSIIKHRWIHHTSFLWDYEVKNMGYLKLPAKAPNYRLARGHTDFVCRMKEFLPRSEFVQRTIEAIRSRFSLEPVAENIADIDVPSTTHFAPSTKLLTDHDTREVSTASL